MPICCYCQTKQQTTENKQLRLLSLLVLRALKISQSRSQPSVPGKAIRFTTVTMSCCAELLAGPSRTGYVCVLALNSECVLVTYSQPLLLGNSPSLSLSDNLPLRVAVLRFAYWVLYRNFLFTFNADHERTYTHICMRALWRSHSGVFYTDSFIRAPDKRAHSFGVQRLTVCYNFKILSLYFLADALVAAFYRFRILCWSHPFLPMNSLLIFLA